MTYYYNCVLMITLILTDWKAYGIGMVMGGGAKLSNINPWLIMRVQKMKQAQEQWKEIVRAELMEIKRQIENNKWKKYYQQ